MSDLRQHVERRHAVPLFCPVCFELFNDEMDRDQHIRLGACEVSYTRPEGLSRSQLSEISRRSNPRSQGEVERWYIMWDIAFPDVAHPSSPYLPRQHLIQAVQGVIKSAGQGTVKQIVGEEGPVAEEAVAEEAVDTKPWAADHSWFEGPNVSNPFLLDSILSPTTSQGPERGEVDVPSDAFDAPSFVQDEDFMEVLQAGQPHVVPSPSIDGRPEAPAKAPPTMSSRFNVDSGYGSGELGKRSKLEATPGAPMPAIMDQDENGETGTQYSDPESLIRDPQRYEGYISAFAEELSPLLPLELKGSESGRLISYLLQSFAVRFGHESPGSLQEGLMFLVHKYREYVILSPQHYSSHLDGSLTIPITQGDSQSPAGGDVRRRLYRQGPWNVRSRNV